MMSKDKLAATSPTRFNGELDHFFDPNFTEEISHRMQVPKRIKVNGENEDDVVMGVGGHNPPPVWENEKFDMHVPDRILVVDNPDPEYCSSPRKGGTSLPLSRVKSTDTMMSIHSNWRHTPSFSVPIPRSDGPLSRPLTGCTTYRPRSRMSPNNFNSKKSGQDQLIGTRGTPIEVNHENAVLPPDPGLIRVQTPPRVITLTDHYFPSADDVPSPIVDEPTPISAVIRPSRAQAPLEPDDRRNEIHTVREGTPSFAEGMTTNEEVAHLRRQLAKLNRRVMSIELENLQRQQYEKIVFLLGAAYAVWKTLLWLRNS